MTLKGVRGNPALEKFTTVVALLSAPGAAGPGPTPHRADARTARRRLLHTPHVCGPVG